MTNIEKQNWQYIFKVLPIDLNYRKNVMFIRKQTYKTKTLIVLNSSCFVRNTVYVFLINCAFSEGN